MEIKTNKEQSTESGKLEKTIEKHHWFIGGYAILAGGMFISYLMLRFHIIRLPAYYQNLFSKICMAGFWSFLVLLVSRFIQRVSGKKNGNKAARYNIVRLVRLVAGLIIIMIIISVVNQNWYTAAVSLGLFSLLLGFALQTPISSLIGWFYIVIRTPFRVGERIQVGDFTGDVVEINYFDTTLWEFSGTYMTNDLPSGRLIRFPNSMVFQYQVYNYSWHKFPYIWNEIPFHVAYESDLGFIEKKIREIAAAEIGPGVSEQVSGLRNYLERTPVDDMEITEYPFVHFRTNANTWVEVLLIYLVDPKESGSMRSRLIKRILEELLKEPDKAMFPKSNAR